MPEQENYRVILDDPETGWQLVEFTDEDTEEE